jgi:hypothetical protein
MSWWASRGHAQVNPSNPQAFGICDECGFLYNLNKLRYQYQWAGPKIINLRFRVCPTCYDEPSHRNYPFALPPDPVPVVDPRPWPTSYNFGFVNNAGVLTLTSLGNYPTSAVRLPPGAVWSNSLVITVVPGVLPSPLFPAVFYGGEIDAQQLLQIGGGNLPLTDPHVNTQLWNNAGVVYVSSG